jgi:Holliday junction DNA helicase RuvA
MIHFLKGIIAEVGDDYMVMDVNGVGYKVLTHARMLANHAEGEATTVSTHMHVREDQMTLFGFTDPSERKLFEVLTSVSGVGPKMGLAILSALSGDEITGAISMQDPTMLTRASGVGKKLAERIILELKNKVGSLPVSVSTGATGGSVVSMPITGLAGDVLSALTNLGYKQNHAKDAVAMALKEQGDSADFDGVFKQALKELRV